MVFNYNKRTLQEAEEAFRRFLKSRRLRCTPERLTILRECMTSPGHFEADDIFVRLRQKKRRVSQTSVYRTLPLLVDAGIVRKTPCDHMEARYEPIFGLGHHDHLICLQCGQTVEFHSSDIERLQEAVAEKYGFTMVGHRLILSGYCRACRKAQTG